MTVTLRQRQKGNKISLYLDIYHAGVRKYEYLELYLTPKPAKGQLSKEQKDENRINLQLAESIRTKRAHELQSGLYGITDLTKQKGSFLKYFEYMMEKRKDSAGNYGNWDSTYKQLKAFVKFDVTFQQVDAKFLEDFKDYLKNTARTPGAQHLSSGTQCSYFNKVRACLNQAYKEGIITKNPVAEVSGIKAVSAEREFLTIEELQALVNTDCPIKVLKTAFVFSCLTGLRWSDVNNLTWADVFHSDEIGYYIRFSQIKTQEAETLPISDQVYSMLPEKQADNNRVFVGLKYSASYNKVLHDWVEKAGIKKSITFHCGRHTYATLQLTFGTDIYTVSKLLGHKDVKTTQIYGKIIDKRKAEAANKIKLDL